jgi:hypothetical protein
MATVLRRGLRIPVSEPGTAAKGFGGVQNEALHVRVISADQVWADLWQHGNLIPLQVAASSRSK